MGVEGGMQGEMSVQGGEKESSIVAMHKNAKVERGVPENQVAEHEKGNSTQEAAHKQQDHRTEKFRFPCV